MTPYRYGLNNPTKFTDPNGMFEYEGPYGTKNDSEAETGAVSHYGVFKNSPSHIGVKVTKSDDGKITVDISVTGVLINKSSTQYSKEALENYAMRINKAIERSFSGSYPGLEYRAKSDIRAVSDLNTISSSDHVFIIVDEGKIPDGIGGFQPIDQAGYADFGQNYVYLARFLLTDEYPDECGKYDCTGLINSDEGWGASLERTVAHELGHSATLHHPPYDSPLQPFNLMYQSGVQYGGLRLSPENIQQIINSYPNAMNHGAQKARTKF